MPFPCPAKILYCDAAAETVRMLQVANYMVRDLAQGTMTAELLQPDELVSGLIAQARQVLISLGNTLNVDEANGGKASKWCGAGRPSDFQHHCTWKGKWLWLH